MVAAVLLLDRSSLAQGRPPHAASLPKQTNRVEGPFSIDEVPKADVVVALGVQPEGQLTPSPGMMSNLLTAIHVLRSGKAQLLMVCGGYTRGHIAEAEMMAIVAQGLGVPRSSILLENGSVDTEENARNAGMIAAKHGLSSAILVAQKGHMKRASGLFQQAGTFSRIFTVVGKQIAPEFPAAQMEAPVGKGTYDAIVVHGVSLGFDFSADPLLVDSRLVAMLSAASGLYRQKLASRIIVWHPTTPHGHVRRTEVMAILLAAMGVPEQSLSLCSARRYEGGTLQISKVCTDCGARSVLALLPPDKLLAAVRDNGRINERDLGGPASSSEAEQMYKKAGIKATLVTVELE